MIDKATGILKTGRPVSGQVAARKPGDGGLKVIEDAPGSYVKTKATK